MNKATVFVLYCPGEDAYFSKVHSKGSYPFRGLEIARQYTTLEKLGDTLLSIRRGRPDVVPIPIELSHEITESFTRPGDCKTTHFDYDPIKNEALKNYDEMVELQRQYDIDVDAMSEANWRKYKRLKYFYQDNGYASFDRKTKKLTWIKELAHE